MSKDEKSGSGGSGASAGNPSGALNSSAALDTSNQLQSINEEAEAQDGGGQMPNAANLSRNTPGRQSKEFTAKLHKVSFPNFKKLKDKESKSKSSPGGSGSGGGGSGGEQEQMAAPTKRASILKDKLINRNSVPSSDSIEGSEKVSLKMKNISLDSGTSSSGGGTAGSVLLLGPGGNNSFDLAESSSDPLENSIATRPSILPLERNGVATGNGNNNVQVYQL